MYKFTITWADGFVTEQVAETQWIAQNLAYQDRFGLGNPCPVSITEMHPAAFDAIERCAEMGKDR